MVDINMYNNQKVTICEMRQIQLNKTNLRYWSIDFNNYSLEL